MDKLIEVLRGLLAEIGLDEPSQEAFINKLLSATSDEPPVEGQPVEGDPTTEPTEGDVPPAPPTDVPTDVPSDVPSTDLPTDDVPPEGDPQQVPPEEVTQSVPPVPPGPAFDPTELISKIEEVTNRNAELQKALDGTLARVDALEEALKNAGVIDGSEPTTQVGDPLPSAAPQSPTDDVFGSVLSELNGHKRF